METKNAINAEKKNLYPKWIDAETKKQGNLNICLVANPVKRNIKTSTSERIEMKSTENSANGRRESEERRRKELSRKK